MKWLSLSALMVVFFSGCYALRGPGTSRYRARHQPPDCTNPGPRSSANYQRCLKLQQQRQSQQQTASRQRRSGGGVYSRPPRQPPRRRIDGPCPGYFAKLRELISADKIIPGVPSSEGTIRTEMNGQVHLVKLFDGQSGELLPPKTFLRSVRCYTRGGGAAYQLRREYQALYTNWESRPAVVAARGKVAQQKAAEAQRAHRASIQRAKQIRNSKNPWQHINDMTTARYVYPEKYTVDSLSDLRNLNATKGQYVYIRMAEVVQATGAGTALVNTHVGREQLRALVTVTNPKFKGYAFREKGFYHLLAKSQGVTYYTTVTGARQQALKLSVVYLEAS